MVKWIAWVVFAALVGLPAGRAEEPFDRARERARMLELLQQSRETELILVDMETADPRYRWFLQNFERRYWPIQRRVNAAYFERAIFHIALDRALYDSPEERTLWDQRKREAAKTVDALITDPRTKDTLRFMAALAEGLPGELAEMVRREHRLNELTGFSRSELPLLNRATDLSALIDDASNRSPVSAGLGPWTVESQAVEQALSLGHATGAQALERLQVLAPRSRIAHGAYLATHAGAAIDELAVVRTELARAKGFATWAEYSLASQAPNYAPGYQSATDRVRFLEAFLAGTKDLHRTIAEMRAREIGLPLEAVSVMEQNLLKFPAERPLLPFFPSERILDFWTETMRESGFSRRARERITWDSYPRDGKHGHAYMYSARPSKLRELRIHAPTLSVDQPAFRPKDWLSSAIFIVQNWRGAGPNNYRVAFHEGGHGMDLGERADIFGIGGSTAYNEVHSFSHEAFLRDRDVLADKLRSLDGQAIPDPYLDLYLTEIALNDLGDLRLLAVQALYDIIAWDHAYASGSEGFVERSGRLYEELFARYMPLRASGEVNGAPLRYAFYAGPHLYSGWVSYIGYVYAKIGAEMTITRVYDRLERQTGRRSLHRQPGIARMLIEGYYRHGYERPFPLSVEAFARQPYEPTRFSERLVQRIEGLLERRKALLCEVRMLMTSGG